VTLLFPSCPKSNPLPPLRTGLPGQNAAILTCWALACGLSNKMQRPPPQTFAASPLSPPPWLSLAEHGTLN